MSDKKLDLILDELHSLREESNKRFTRNEEMLGTLIQMVGKTNAKLEELAVDVTDSRGNARYFNHKLADIEMEVNKSKNR